MANYKCLVQCCRADKCDIKHCEHAKPHRPSSMIEHPKAHAVCTFYGMCSYHPKRVRCVYVKNEETAKIVNDAEEVAHKFNDMLDEMLPGYTFTRGG